MHGPIPGNAGGSDLIRGWPPERDFACGPLQLQEERKTPRWSSSARRFGRPQVDRPRQQHFPVLRSFAEQPHVCCRAVSRAAQQGEKFGGDVSAEISENEIGMSSSRKPTSVNAVTVSRSSRASVRQFV